MYVGKCQNNSSFNLNWSLVNIVICQATLNKHVWCFTCFRLIFVEHPFIDHQHLLLRMLGYIWMNTLTIAYVTMLSFDCVLKPITHSFLSLWISTHFYSFTYSRLHANFIQHKWLVDHSTSIATKAEMLVPSISGILLCNLYSATHTYRAHKRR